MQAFSVSFWRDGRQVAALEAPSVEARQALEWARAHLDLVRLNEAARRRVAPRPASEYELRVARTGSKVWQEFFNVPQSERERPARVEMLESED